MRIDCFYNSWMASRASVRKWLEQLVHYYNHHRPHQALDGKVPVAEVQN